MPAWNSKAHLYKAEAIRRVEQGEFKDDLAKEFGVAVGTMHQWTLGVPQKGRREYKSSRAHPDEIRQLAIKLVTEGARVKEVASTLNVWPTTIDNWLRDTGISGRVNPFKASREEAIRRVNQGEPKATVAASLSISKTSVARWTKGIILRKIISDATKQEVARRAENGEAKIKISRELDINLNTINELTKHVRVHEISQELKDEFIRRVKSGEPPIALTREFRIPIKRYHRWRTAGLFDVMYGPSTSGEAASGNSIPKIGRNT